MEGLPWTFTGLPSSLSWFSMGVNIAWVNVRREYAVAESIEHTFGSMEAGSTEY